MAFKDIHKLKKIVEVQKEFIETDHLIVGKDIFAISLYKSLVEKHGESSVRLLSEDQISSADILMKGPSTIRGEENKKVIQNLYPDIATEAVNAASLYYKDLTWKAFGGRSKPEALKFDEEFFVSSRLNVDESSFHSWFINSEETIHEINSKAYQVKIKSIIQTDEKYLVECINGTEFKTRKLYFGKSPFYFLNHYTEKNHLSDHFIQFCESTKTVHGLFIKYIFNEKLTELNETLFIPLSYTHEWGHFVGEFKTQNNKQVAEFLHYIDEDHTNEEEISRTIRQLKKSFEKIFENFSKIKFQEFISIEDEMGCLKIDDSLFDKCLDENFTLLNNLHFIGVNAPIKKADCGNASFEYSREGVNLLARALIVERLIQPLIF